MISGSMPADSSASTTTGACSVSTVVRTFEAMRRVCSRRRGEASKKSWRRAVAPSTTGWSKGYCCGLLALLDHVVVGVLLAGLRSDLLGAGSGQKHLVDGVR